MDPTAPRDGDRRRWRPHATVGAAADVPHRLHWDALYEDNGAHGVSWFQDEPAVSLELVRATVTDPDTPVIDVGGGTSLLVDRLVEVGCTDLTVLDVSVAALVAARRRLTGHAAAVTWLHADVLNWRPARRYGLWHDRAVFHFLVAPADRQVYLDTLRHALRPDGRVVLATFAPDGPDHCSGLPVVRYSPEGLGATLGEGFTVTHVRREEHTTPAGAVQPFTWIAARPVPSEAP